MDARPECIAPDGGGSDPGARTQVGFFHDSNKFHLTSCRGGGGTTTRRIPIARATWRWRMTLWTTCSTLSKDLPTAIRANTISLNLFSRYKAHQGQHHIIDPFQSVQSPSSETDPSQEPYWHPATPISARLGGSDDIIAETASSVDLDVESDGFELEKVVPLRNAYNLDYRAWIGSIHGTPIAVPANGPCLYLAFYATTTNTQAKKLTLRSATVAAADIVKQRVIDIVLANLRYDVKLRLILPKEELQRIYPGEQPPNSQEAAAAMLYAHYVKMRAVSVGTPVPQAYREGPTVLRGMAVYLREPVYVWDIDEADRAYVQQYTFKRYEMDNGDQQETGTVTPLSEDKIRDILEACFRQQVIPTMLLLKHTEGHFYEVQHGDTFHEWHAQCGSEMRERLDQVPRLVGLPALPSAGYDPASVAEEAANEEQALLEEMGVDFYASGSQPSAMPEVAVTSVQRVRIDQHAAVHLSGYERLLTNHDLKAMDAIDSRLAARLHRANDEAYAPLYLHYGVIQASSVSSSPDPQYWIWIWGIRSDPDLGSRSKSLQPPPGLSIWAAIARLSPVIVL
ncbi:hypothetical protein PR001_g4617 [Phytophthora rubi]|uniref:OTU domain-containing protein n=1 Tax=Phytophthora rubi TaxID=129364 RepID=A0A6A3NXS1_9STRA|nr:hypothetical protein PR001_g4617 [Phytophthora rubi]